MKHLQLLVLFILISTLTFASNNAIINLESEINTSYIPPCSKTVTVSRSGTYDCNGTQITVTATSTKTATDITCEKATEDAAKAASLQAYYAVLVAIAAGMQACIPA